MKQTFLPKVSEAVRVNIRHRQWQHALLAMAAVVVFITVYMLILPAITMTGPTCGLEEHTHSDSCYELRLVCGLEETPEGDTAHVHGPACYEQQQVLTCGQEEGSGHTHTDACMGYVCGQEEGAGHTHTDACYADVTVEELTCTQEESAGHTHDASCYTVEEELTCGMSEGEGGHEHDDGCCDPETGELTCGMSEGEGGHEHDEGCYTQTETLTCTQEESAGHTHDASCYTQTVERQLVCGQEETEGHVHTDACMGYTCGQEESAGHTYTEACYTTQDVLICGESEGHTHTDACYEQVLVCQIPEHTHTEECYASGEEAPVEEIPEEDVPLGEYACGKEEHAHTQDCYDADGNLICALEEHAHDESCLAEELPEYICGKEEHAHTEDCYDAGGNLICALEEHAHDETCLPVEQEPGAFPEELPEGYGEYEYEDADTGLSVLAYAPEGAFEEDVELQAQVLDQDSDAYADAQANLEDAGALDENTGMAALDISFRNADGDEVEPDPAAGPVYVRLDARALIPDGVDENTVAVQHHAETTDGGLFGTGIFAGTEVEVETVADSSGDTGEVTLTPSARPLAAPLSLPAGTEEAPEEEAAAALDVEARFAVDGFSTFTITWGYGDRYSRPVSVYLNDTEISLEDLNKAISYGSLPETVTFNSTDWKNIGDWLLWNTALPNSITYEGKTYSYERAGDTAGSTIVWARVSDNGAWQISSSDSRPNNQGTTFPANEPLRLYYSTPNASKIDGSDTSDTIQISLFDYTNKNLDSSLSKDNVNGNSNSMSLLFSGANGTYNGGTITNDTNYSWWNYWTDKSGGVIQGIVQPELGKNGNPVLAVGDKDSLDYLYSESHYAKAYTGLNKLFRYDSSTGYYSFDSSLNFATINPNGNGSYDKNFTLYDKPNTGTSSGSTGHPYFIPFNDYGTNENGNDWDSGANYHFGMKITAEFAMPKDGQVNGTDMIFSFTGDDDVWVYIDGVLILDMGGIHDSCSGSINFAEGTVTANKVYGIIDESGNSIERTENQPETAHIGDLLHAAYLGNQTYIDANLEYRDGHWYLKDYMSHQFSFFYLERGAVDSNCQIEFNLYTLQKNSLNVAKTLDTYTSAGEGDSEAIESYLSNLEYTFRVLKKEALPSTTNENDLFIKPGTSYQIVKNGVATGRTGVVETDGTFTIKAGETAVFTNIAENSGAYYVQEIVKAEYEEQFGDVTVSVKPDGGTSYGEEAGVTLDEEEFVGMISGDLSSENTGYVNFTNKVDITELSVLKITKAAVAGSQFGERAFTVEVMLGGEPVERNTPYTLYSAERPDGVQRSVERAGEIQLKPGETAAFLVLTGTEYTISEVDGSEYHVGYSATQTIGQNSWSSDGEYELTVVSSENGDLTASGVVGQIIGSVTDATNATVEVTVTNSSYDFNTSLDLSKTLNGYSAGSYDFSFEVQQVDSDGTALTQDFTGTPVGTDITIDSSASETGTIYFGFENTDNPGTYYYKVSEIIPTENLNGISYDESYYIVEVTISEGTPKNASVSAVTKYGKSGTSESFEWTTGTALPFTNSLTGSLSITKTVEYNGDPEYTSNAVFAFDVTVADASGDGYTVTYGNLTWDEVKDYTGWPEGTTALPATANFENGKATVYVPAGATIQISGLPAAATATITETTTDGYAVSWSGATATSNDSSTHSVTTAQISTNPAVTCTNTTGAVLPSTGGPGVANILTLGTLLTLGAGALLLLQRRRKEGDAC